MRRATAPPAHTGGRPRDAGATEAILAAALRQLETVGYVKMSMESVAAEAGVARTTVYRRFRDKGDLVTAAIASDKVLGDGALTLDPRADLVAFVEEFDRRSGRCLLEVLGSLLGSHEEAGTLELHRRRVVGPRSAYGQSLLARAAELGQLRADVDLELALQMLVGAVFARSVAGTADRPGWVAEAVEAIWRAWAPDPGAALAAAEEPGEVTRARPTGGPSEAGEARPRPGGRPASG